MPGRDAILCAHSTSGRDVACSIASSSWDKDRVLLATPRIDRRTTHSAWMASLSAVHLCGVRGAGRWPFRAGSVRAGGWQGCSAGLPGLAARREAQRGLRRALRW